MGLLLVFRRKLHVYAGVGWHLYFTNECSACRAKHLKIEDTAKNISTAESLGLSPDKKDTECMCGTRTRYPAVEYRCEGVAHRIDENGELVPLLVNGKTIPCAAPTIGTGRTPLLWVGDKVSGFNGVIPGHKKDEHGRSVIVNGRAIPTFHCPCQQPIPYPIHLKEFRDHLNALPKWGDGDGRDITRPVHNTWLQGTDGEAEYSKYDPGF